MRRRHLVLLATVAALALTGAACGDDDDDVSSADAEAALCNEQQVLSDGIAQLAAIDPGTATVDDAEAIADQVRAQIGEIEDAAEDVAESELEALEEAYDDFEDALESVSGDDTLSGATAEIEAATAAVQDAWDELLTAADCPG
jgi:hypothetical protein